MSVINMVTAINQALDLKLSEDPSVLIFGEDAGREGGVFRVTQGLYEKYGKKRVFDTPLAESAIIGTAVGMCIGGLRPVAEIQFSGFVYPAFNQIISHVARFRNRTRGRFPMPMVIRMPYGGGVKALESHSESMEALFAHIPGLKVVIPSTPYDAVGLLISAIEDDDPVVFMEPKRVYRAVKQEVPSEKFAIPIGKARVVNRGTDITVAAYGAMIRECQKALVMAREAGISVELVDLRTLYPLDHQTLGESIRKTGRFLSVTEGPSSFGAGAELISIATQEAFLHLEAPPSRLAGFDITPPFPKNEQYYFFGPDRIFYEIKKLMDF